MSLPTRVTLAPSGRPIGGLLSAARPIGGEWWRGVTFTTGQCLVPQLVGHCPEGQIVKETERSSPVATFESFGVIQAVRCSTFSRAQLTELAEQSLDVTREFGISRELLAGAASGNPSLADALDLGAATDVVAALGCLEHEANEAMAGRLAFIHVSSPIATALLSESAIWRDGRLWRTASGNIVVSSPGYDGRSPGGAPPADGDTLYAYATGEVYVEAGQRQTLSAVERSQNTDETWSEDAAIVVFDPCFAVAVDTGVQLCVLTS